MAKERPSFEYSPGLDGVPCAESKVCYLDGNVGKLQYRGYPIEVLAENATYEETAYLLIKGSLPIESELKAWKRDLVSERRLKFRILDMLKCMPESGHPMDALDAAIAALGMFYPGKHVDNKDVRYWSCVRLIAKVPAVVAAFHRLRQGDDPIPPREDLDHAANFLWMLSGTEPAPLVAKVLDVCLTLHAEHSMNASTFSGRVTGSTLADAYSVVSSAVGTLVGPLHGGANEEVLIMLRDIGSVENVARWAEGRIKSKQKIMGMGHREYKVKDPRATILQKLCVQLFDQFGSTPLYDIACELERVTEPQYGPKGVYPNVDFYSGIVYEKMGIPVDLFTPIFAIARVAGWLAHWLEQVENNRIFRPSQIYTGDVDQKWTPLAERKPKAC